MKRQPLQDTTFFMLTPDVRDRLLETNLTAAEWRIWCYLVSLDPFGDRGAKFSPAELMLKCGIKKSTYFAAKAKFQKLGLFDFKDGVTKVFNLQTTLACSETSSHSQQEEFIESKISESSSEILDSCPKIRNVVRETGKDSENLENKTPKSLPEEDSSISQTIQTYSDFIQTLSEGEREKFLNFVREQIKNLPKQVNDVEAWLANKNQAGINRWEVYYNNFLIDQRNNRSRSSMPRNSQTPELQKLIAEFRQKHKEEIEQRRIAAERTFQEKTATTQSVDEIVASEPVKEKLAELLGPSEEPPHKKRNGVKGIWGGNQR